MPLEGAGMPAYNQDEGLPFSSFGVVGGGEGGVWKAGQVTTVIFCLAVGLFSGEVFETKGRRI